MKSHLKFLPEHLQRYVVDQHYERYTPEDQAVWRFIMRQLKAFLSFHAHSCYLDGLTKTAIDTESIPHIDEMDDKLKEFGWRAVAVSGFIPPAAFMEFQSLGFLPIACDMRTLEHVLYTPAPDIVHEAAGHAPILIQPDFANYLRKYAEVAKNAILSKEDLEQYQAIRELSDIKENPESTAADILKAEEHLMLVNKKIRFTSEAGYLSRMNWWTAEYGLIGPIELPKIYGAGLLSSIGESREFMSPTVRKIPFSIECLDYSYDITEPQPQLFVAPDFVQLQGVLEELANRMSYRRGGDLGVETALQAQTVNTVEFNSGIQISGLLSHIHRKHKEPVYLQFTGPCQLSIARQQLHGHGTDAHAHGFGTPLGFLKDQRECLSAMSLPQLANLQLVKGQKAHLQFQSGVQVVGQCAEILRKNDRNVLISFTDCTVSLGTQILFQPDWGRFDMAVGSSIPSVFGGPADRHQYEGHKDFVSSRVPQKNYSPEQKKLFEFYAEIRRLREQKTKTTPAQVTALCDRFFSECSSAWLVGVELLEWTKALPNLQAQEQTLVQHLKSKTFSRDPMLRFCVDQGIQLADHGL